MDHGLLNLPLSKRGNIDRDIDRLKAQQARDAKNKAKEHRKRMAEAKAIVAAMTDERIAEIAAGLGITLKQARKRLNQMAHWEPLKILKTKTTPEATPK